MSLTAFFSGHMFFLIGVYNKVCAVAKLGVYGIKYVTQK